MQKQVNNWYMIACVQKNKRIVISVYTLYCHYLIKQQSNVYDLAMN